ncbi:FIST signal transduction protein [Anaeromicropila herbilytica]|uniref:FIST domain-containing protein n=1 Tax=Anaeromicropila herbilytica TaxID=2785025 RepID=A0A7R7IEQ8_9FIRM|nr:FIST N-terminal domain-containing protein [Anaeromicropila herbilytica]BCN32958.1 hypothetical protein bsdtb5_42530 [Anaeromicropila herbilytica]
MFEALYFKSLEESKNFIASNHSKGILLFASDQIVRDLSQYAGENVVLCSTAGEFTKEGYKEEVITGFTYDRGVASIVELENPSIRNINELRKAYDKVKDNKNAFMLLLCNGLAAHEESIISTFFFIKDDFKIVGGSSGDYLQFKETLIYIGKKKVDSVAIFFDCKSRTQLVKENIYKTTEKKLLVTEADPLSRTVYKFDNVPAATKYAQLIGIREEKLADSFSNHPLGRVIKQNTYIASPMKVNPDKSITFYSQILPNTFVDVLEPADLDNCFHNTINMLEFKPTFIFSVHCILRSLKFKEEHSWGKLDSKLLQVCKNQSGFISYGEQIYKKHLNQTMVLLAIE